MKYLFVHANSSQVVYQDLAKSDSAIETPIWAALLENSLSTHGVGCDLLDCEVLGLTWQESAQRIADSGCEIAVFCVYGQQPSASTQNMTGCVGTAELLKQISPEITIAFVGAHVSALPSQTLDAHDCIDIVFTNEGVLALHDIAKIHNLSNKLQNVQGIAYRDSQGEIHINPASNTVSQKQLDNLLPGINWNKVNPVVGYRTSGWHSWLNNSEKTPFASIYTSLGCPYRCSFCMINIINRTHNDQINAADMNGFRYWDPETTIDQIQQLADLGVKNIKFADELFVLNPNHFLKICQLIIDRGITDLNIWAYARVDTCKPEYLDILRQAGVKSLALGIENPDPDQRKLIHKQGFNNVNIGDLVRLIQSHDIAVAGNYIFGLHGDTQETMQRTLDFAKQNLTDMANFYCAMAYPGSPLYTQAIKENIKLPESYSGYSQHSYDCQPLPTQNLSASEILKFRDHAWNEYHGLPEYEKLLNNKYGPHAVDQLIQTRSKVLMRKLLEENNV